MMHEKIQSDIRNDKIWFYINPPKEKKSIPPEQMKQISTKSPPVQYIILYSMIHMM